MQITQTHKIIISAVVIIVLLGIYIAFDRKSKRENNTVDITQPATTTATTTSSGGVQTQGTGGYTIEQVPIESGKGVPQPVPDLNREPVLSAGAIISPEAMALAVQKIKTLQVTLKSNPANLPAWIDLGIYQKQAGDYAGLLFNVT